jgi:hypothetical protein
MLSDRPYLADDRTEELITDKIARLERENAELKTEIQRLYKVGEFKHASYEKLFAENAELRKDAERLDFYATNTSLVIEVVGTWYHRKGYGQMARKAKSLRAAIDEAMKS